jgi:hypothetical protein
LKEPDTVYCGVGFLAFREVVNIRSPGLGIPETGAPAGREKREERGPEKISERVWLNNIGGSELSDQISKLSLKIITGKPYSLG